MRLGRTNVAVVSILKMWSADVVACLSVIVLAVIGCNDSRTGGTDDVGMLTGS